LTPSAEKYNDKPFNNSNSGGWIMKGKIFSWETKEGGRYGVTWYYAPHKKSYKLRLFDGRKMWHEKDAEALLANMRNDYERGVFRIERWTRVKSGFGLWLDEWLKIIKPNLKPATFESYQSKIKIHIKPWFDDRRIGIHEIDYMVLLSFANSLQGQLEPSSIDSVLGVVRSALKDAQKANIIQTVPEPVEKKKLGIVKKPIEYITEDRQLDIIDATDPVHHPILHWLRLHLRRPGEARALQKEDFDGSVFTIKHNFSKNVLMRSTKTSEWFETPMAKDFAPYYEWMRKQPWWMSSKFFFVNPNSHRGHYAASYLNIVWDRAAKKCGESISLYRGLVSSSITIMCEMGIPVQEIALASGKSVETIMQYYLHATIASKKSVLDRVIKFPGTDMADS